MEIIWMIAEKGMKINFNYNGKDYSLPITEIMIYKNYVWIGELGCKDEVYFAVHGDLYDYKPIMRNLKVQYDGIGIHGYIDNVSFEY